MKIYFNFRNAIDYLIAIATATITHFSTIAEQKIFLWPTGDKLVTLMLSISASSISLLGFVLAANTFLISHAQNERLKMFRKSGGFVQLIDIMRSNLWRLLMLSVCSGFGSLVLPRFENVALSAVVFLLTLSLLALITLIWSTMAVLSLPVD